MLLRTLWEMCIPTVLFCSRPTTISLTGSMHWHVIWKLSRDTNWQLSFFHSYFVYLGEKKDTLDGIKASKNKKIKKYPNDIVYLGFLTRDKHLNCE